MDFTTIGKVNSYIKQKNLLFAANYKIKTGQRVTNSNGGLSFSTSSMFEQVAEITKKSNEDVKAARLASIKTKLMSGKKLTDEEMGYLRVNDKDLYKKAKHADDAREELKAELKGAKSKQEARKIVAQAMVRAAAEASAELAACKGGAVSGSAVAGNVSGATPTADISVNAENLSATSTENLSVNTSAENISVSENPATSTENVSNAQENPATSTENISSDKNSDDEKPTVEGILEKFIMTIRALEDEWTQFANSDRYKDLPEDINDDEKVYTVAEIPNKKVLDAVFAYRQPTITKNISYKFNATEVDAWKSITLQS